MRQLKYKMASSFDSEEYYCKRRPEGLSMLEEVIEESQLPQTHFETSEFAGKDVSEMG